MTRGAETIELPGLVDIHVHPRGFDQSEKEDPTTCSQAALSAGVTTYAAMPNYEPVSVRPYSLSNMANVQAASRGRIYTDVGFWGASQPEYDNVGELAALLPSTVGVKFYMEPTQGNDEQFDPSDFFEASQEIHRVDPKKVIAAHTEDATIEAAISMIAGELQQPLHIPHVNNRFVMDAIIKARRAGLPVTSGVTPHHLLLTESEVADLGWYGRMKPVLGTDEDRDYLWYQLAIGNIDVIETDHAPHTRSEKDRANDLNPSGDLGKDAVKSFGVPGLETMLPLLLHEVIGGKGGLLGIEDIVRLLHVNPRRILGLTNKDTTAVRVDMTSYEVGDQQLHSKCGWTPFAGRLVTGKVVAVERDGATLFRSRAIRRQGTTSYHDSFAEPQGKVLFAA